MAREQMLDKSCPRLLTKIAATAGISMKVNELREALEECIAGGKQPGAGIIDHDLQ
jgi:hypothetical protein